MSCTRHSQIPLTSDAAGWATKPGALMGGALAARVRGGLAVGIIMATSCSPGSDLDGCPPRGPMLVLVNNNRTYLNDGEHQTQVARTGERRVANAHVGTNLDEPYVDLEALDRSQGAWTEGPR